MKPLIAVLSLVALPLTLHAETAVEVQVNNIGSAEGQIVVTFFNSDESWLQEPYLVETVDAADAIDGSLMIPLTLEAGEYAISAYHDLDGNGRMKTNFIGIPREPIGTSNDAKGRFGPPKYKDAKFQIGEEATTIPINLVDI